MGQLNENTFSQPDRIRMGGLKITVIEKTKVHVFAIIRSRFRKTEKFIGILGNDRIGMVQK
jgi:hypothetical protein